MYALGQTALRLYLRMENRSATDILARMGSDTLCNTQCATA
jgi:hypothetical protein